MEMYLNPDEDGNVNEEFEGQIAYYASQLIEFDKALESIVNYLEERGEPTYLMMYSDHLPTLTNNLIDSDATRYTTQFFTWNNLGIEKDTEVVADGYFHESEYRAAPYFDLQIDGIELLNTMF